MGFIVAGLSFWIILFVILSPLLFFIPALRSICLGIWKVIGGFMLLMILVFGGLFGIVAVVHFATCTRNCGW